MMSLVILRKFLKWVLCEYLEETAEIYDSCIEKLRAVCLKLMSKRNTP